MPRSHSPPVEWLRTKDSWKRRQIASEPQHLQRITVELQEVALYTYICYQWPVTFFATTVTDLSKNGKICYWTNDISKDAHIKIFVSVRTNLIREHGADPCFPDPSFLHPELVNGNGSPSVCPMHKLDGSEGPVYTFRFEFSGRSLMIIGSTFSGVDATGKYTSFDNNNISRFEYSAAENVVSLASHN